MEIDEEQKVDRKPETGVQITVGKPVQEQPEYVEDENMDYGNPYLYATGGPKKQRDLAAVGQDEEAMEPEYETGYSVTGGDKFTIGQYPRIEPNKRKTSEEEIAEALEKIRQQELDTEEYNKTLSKYLEQGPNVYELFSVMVHSGGAFGGHYYAYIKSFSDNKWYEFNDTDVKEIDTQ